MDHVVLGTGDDYISSSRNNAVTPPPAALAGVEYGLIDEGGVARNIWRRMNELDVPGVSVAVIDGGQVRYARGYGRLEGNGDRSGRFAHGGYIPNYSWTRMVGVPSAGKGIVIMTNDTSLDARRLVCEIEDAFRTQNGIPSGGC